ncbi:MAG: hypothetical protein LH650_02895 [Chloroflexi bacterium]|nr:hypothetical protein [Chloroflexota bacterium]
MDGLAPSPRRSDRPMVSQDAGRGNDGRRRGPVGPGTLEPTDDGNLSLGRRMGVLVVLAALGGAIVLAAGGVGGSDPVTPLASATPTATTRIVRTPRPLPSPPTVAPEILVPDQTLITTRTIDLRLDVPDPGTSMAGMEVRVYRNSNELQSARVDEVGRVKVRGIPLRRGSNKLTAAIANPGGEGPRSVAVTITVDDQAPVIKVRSPRSGTTLNELQVTLEGRTEDGLTVNARNVTRDSRASAVASASGDFQVQLGLTPGRNTIILSGRDVAGNKGTTTMVVVRGDGKTSVVLKLSRAVVRLKNLPRTVDATVMVLDAGGRPLEGAAVMFTISPSGQLTSTFPTTSGKDGTATWSGIRLSRAGATVGDGLVSVRVVAPDGSATRDSVQLDFK